MESPSDKENLSPSSAPEIRYPPLPMHTPPARNKSILFDTPARRPPGGRKIGPYQPNTSRRRRNVHTFAQALPRLSHSKKVSRVFAPSLRPVLRTNAASVIDNPEPHMMQSSAKLSCLPHDASEESEAVVKPDIHSGKKDDAEALHSATDSQCPPCQNSTIHNRLDNNRRQLNNLERAVAVALSSPLGSSSRRSVAARRRAFHIPLPRSPPDFAGCETSRSDTDGESTESWTGDEEFFPRQASNRSASQTWQEKDEDD